VIYINKNKINNEELFLWQEENKKTNFINKYLKFLIDGNNKFTVKLSNSDQYEYIKHIVLIEQKIFYDDEINNK
jgi:flagellar motor component MotA